VPTPLCDGFLAIGAAITGRDFRAEGRTFEKLGLDTLSRDAMRAMLHAGLAA
jgi:opine dehydrogenase